MLTASSADKEYNSGMIGNGEIMTMVGPTGYHNGRCPPEEKVNRTIFWAGRRLKDARSANIRIPRVSQEELIGPTLPLVRFGRLSRTLEVNGQATKDDEWEQTFDPDGGRFLSVLDHSHIEERTESLACLTKNTLIFHTTLSSTDSETVRLKFILEYDFGDSNGEKAEGTRLYIRRPHPDDLEFGNVEGTRSAEMNIDGRPPHLRESLSIQYEIEKHL
jgi:hypothetical protein